VISRHWTAVVQPAQEERYLQHLRSETFPQLARIPGFVRATVLSRPMEDGVEFRVVTVWESLDAVREFAGPLVERAVVPTAVREFMVRFDSAVVHYDVRDMYEPD
jgi:heme-degrading monooxygenase HmoA